MKVQEENYRWIFQILAGRKPEETSQAMGKYRMNYIADFYNCISEVKILDGLDREYVEKILAVNYYMGMKIYNYIVRRYYSKKQVKIYIRKNKQLFIKALQKEGMIVIYIPDLNDDFSDGL